MSKDKVESRTERRCIHEVPASKPCAECDAMPHNLAARPSVPEQAQAAWTLAEIQSAIKAFAKDYSDFDERNLIFALSEEIEDSLEPRSALAASRSEAQPPQVPFGCDDNGLVFTVEEKDAIAEMSKIQDLRPAKVITQAIKTYQFIVKGEAELIFKSTLEKAKLAGAPAAGSAERWIPVSEKLPDFPESNRWQDGTHNYNSTDAVLAWDGEEIVKAVMYSDHGKPTTWSEQPEGATVKSVTHWQALPTPPK